MIRPSDVVARWTHVALGAVFAFADARAQDREYTGQEHHAMHDVQTGAQVESAHAPLHEADSDDAQSDDAAPNRADHVSPPPPQHAMGEMTGTEMTNAMEMDDAASTAMLRFDRLERADGDDGVATAWKFAASVGSDFDKLLVRSEGERTHGAFEDADAEVLWNHAVASYWDTQVGLRHDFGRGADRTWGAFGVQGLAPYWFEVGATAYVGDGGRTALRIEVDYDLSLTQRLILQPRVEFNVYGRSDEAARVGSGLSDGAFGLRLRYEIRRELAPYVGIERSRRFGQSADFARDNDMSIHDTRIVAGLRIWY